jgi:hypothetical protein
VRDHLGVGRPGVPIAVAHHCRVPETILATSKASLTSCRLPPP